MIEYSTWKPARLRRDLEPFFDGAGIPRYYQDPNLSDSLIGGGLGGLISEPLTSHPIIKKGYAASIQKIFFSEQEEKI